MNRFRFGIFLLLLLLAGGILIQTAVGQMHMPLAAAMETAADYASAGDLPRAAALVQEVRTRWMRSRTFTAALADHQPLEDIECLLAQLTAYDDPDDPTFCALCRDIARRIRAVAEAQMLTLGSML